MPLAFAISLLGLTWLSETMRQGVFGMSGPEAIALVHVAAAGLAVLILRSDLLLLVRRPVAGIDGSNPADWSMARSLPGVLLGPLLLVIPLCHLLLTGQAVPAPDTLALAVPGAVGALWLKAFLLAVCVELFFREAALKAFRAHLGALVVASVLATFVFHLSGGLAAALIAAGAGLYYLVLRLSGVHILVVALVHSANALVLPVLARPMLENWPSAIFFTVAAAALSLAVYSLSAPKRIELSHA